MPHNEEADEVKDSIRLEDDAKDVTHKNPFGRTSVPTWFWEDPTRSGNVLTQDGITQIAYHKYKAGDYTHLDNFLNPFWTYCTEKFLPMSMAPNMVTTLGGSACLIAYLTTWYYLPNFEVREGETVPAWLLLGNAFAVFLYYTLDCMDGKQARRTGTSSPLGQLFDHGIDCFGNLSQMSVAESILLHGPSRHYLTAQLGLQTAFFGAQWEEYYTGTLPHSYGKYFGVTEVNYGLALVTLISSLLDNQFIYSQTLQETLYPILPIALLPVNKLEPDTFVTIFNSILTTPLKTVIANLWIASTTSIIFGSIHRVAKHIGEVGHFLMALSKLVSPMLVAYMALVVLPEEAILQESRYISIASGLCLCLITIKVIVLSMARMAYASIQKDIIPAVAVFGFIAYELEHAERRRLTPLGLTFVLQVLCVWYLVRIFYWVSIASGQLCERLDVYLFTIKKKKKKSN